MNYLTIGPLKITRDSFGNVRVECLEPTADDGTKREILNTRLSESERATLHELTREE